RLLYFFFQAEDGIRDGHVTGVQTCALPISSEGRENQGAARGKLAAKLAGGRDAVTARHLDIEQRYVRLRPRCQGEDFICAVGLEIGRASCRERVEIWVVGGA